MKRLFIILLLITSLTGYSQEKITNGGFSSESGWTFDGAGYSIGSGVASYNDVAISSLMQVDASMVTGMAGNTTYTLSFKITIISGTCNFTVYSTSLQQYVANTTYTAGTKSIEFTTPTNIGDGGIRFYTYNDGDFTIDDISLLPNAAIGDDPYYVATDGSDDASGAIDHPWKTWQKAFNTAEAGDTVYFRGGTYYPDTDVVLDSTTGYGHSGTFNNWIYFLAYPGETPILDYSKYDPPSAVAITGLAINYTTYVYFKGLTVCNVWQRHTGVTCRGIEAYGCSNLIFDQCVVHDIGGRGFGFFGGFGGHGVDERIPDVATDTTRYINCDAYNLCDTLCTSTDAEYCLTFYPGGVADGFKFNNTAGAYVEFQGCRSWKFSDNGVDPNGLCRILINAFWAFDGGNQVFEGMSGEGGGIKYGNQLDTDNNTLLREVTNSLSAYNRGAGFDENNSREGFYQLNERIYNNTSYSNAIGWTNISRTEGGASPEIFRNNISYNDTQGAMASFDIVNTDHSYNSWDIEGLTVSDGDFVSVDSAGFRGARQADGSLPLLTFLHLAEGSDLINAGVGVGLITDGDGNYFDDDTISIGAFQYAGWAPSGLNNLPSVTTGSYSVLYTRLSIVRGNVTSDGGGAITERGFAYSTTNLNPTVSDSKVVVSGTTGTYYEHISTFANTIYYVRAYATNSEGTTYGATITVETPVSSIVTSGGKYGTINGKIGIIK